MSNGQTGAVASGRQGRVEGERTRINELEEALASSEASRLQEGASLHQQMRDAKAKIDCLEHSLSGESKMRDEEKAAFVREREEVRPCPYVNTWKHTASTQ